MADHRSPSEIEREIEDERRGLTGTLDELQDRFSLDRVTRDAGSYVRDQSGEIGRAVSNAVRDNPVAVILTGVGLAWMLVGSSRARRGHGEGHPDDYGAEYGDYEAYGDMSGPSTVGRSAYPYRAGTEDRYAGGYYDEGASDDSFTRTLSEEDPDWVRGYADVLGTPEDMGEAYRTDRTGGGEDAGDRGEGRMADLRRNAEARMERGRARLAEMRERLAHGTQDMSEEGRRRVVMARERAMEARHRMARQFSRQSRAAQGMYDRQPLVAGALAFAAGAAVAAALPRSRMEDDYMGAQSDRLMEEAERVFAEEREKIGRVARATAEEARAVVNETAGDLREGARSAGEEAREGAERIADRARTEAKKQNLGKPGA